MKAGVGAQVPVCAHEALALVCTSSGTQPPKALVLAMYMVKPHPAFDLSHASHLCTSLN